MIGVIMFKRGENMIYNEAADLLAIWIGAFFAPSQTHFWATRMPLFREKAEGEKREQEKKEQLEKAENPVN